jgi:hypothetical protein
MKEIPHSYRWFSKLKLLKFIPWHIYGELNLDDSISKQFKLETKNREVVTFANRQDQDTYAGFEIIDGNITEKILIFHPSFQTNVEGWNIVENEYSDFFEFLKLEVLPEMKEWIETDDVEDYINN